MICRKAVLRLDISSFQFSVVFIFTESDTLNRQKEDIVVEIEKNKK